MCSRTMIVKVCAYRVQPLPFTPSFALFYFPVQCACGMVPMKNLWHLRTVAKWRATDNETMSNRYSRLQSKPCYFKRLLTFTVASFSFSSSVCLHSNNRQYNDSQRRHSTQQITNIGHHINNYLFHPLPESITGSFVRPRRPLPRGSKSRTRGTLAAGACCKSSGGSKKHRSLFLVHCGDAWDSIVADMEFDCGPEQA